MMRYRFRRIRKPQVFALMMGASAGMLVLPARFTAPVRNLVHLAAYGPQLAATRAGQTLGAKVRDASAPPVPADAYEKVRRENVALTNEMVALRGRVAELNATVQSLGYLRKRGLREGVLVPATVIGLDAAGGRESLLLGKGRLSKIHTGDWVASRLLVHAGSDDGVRDQAAVLAHECLIGWVEDVAPLTARVVLLSDPVASRNVSVHIRPRDSGRQELWKEGKYPTFPLEGAGDGKMRIHDIFRDFVDSGQIAPGDWVVCQPSPRLPASLVIGTIQQFEPVREKPIYYTAVVAPVFDPRSLQQVFVLDLSRDPAG